MSSYQPMLFAQSTRVKIVLNESHEFLKLTKLINWAALIALVETIRETKIQKSTGPKPRYRALIGALVLMAMRKMTYREAEDQITHYAPARYLCDLMDSDMTLDHVTIFEFMQMLGPDGISTINKFVLEIAVDHGLLDSSVLMSDTTAQEAMIPYPNEVGLMSRYMELAQSAIKKLGGKFSSLKRKIKEKTDKVNWLGCILQEGERDKARAGPSGRIYWNTEIITLWFQQAECEKYIGDGEVRPACYFRFQYEKDDTRGGNSECDITNRQGDEIGKQDKIEKMMERVPRTFIKVRSLDQIFGF